MLGWRFSENPSRCYHSGYEASYEKTLQHMGDTNETWQAFRATILEGATLERIAAIRGGLPARCIALVAQELRTTQEEICAMTALAPSSIRRKVLEDSLCEPWATERIARLVVIDRLALEAFESQPVARAWLKTPHRALDGTSPLNMLDTDLGMQLVIGLLQCLIYGEPS